MTVFFPNDTQLGRKSDKENVSRNKFVDMICLTVK